MSADIVLKIWIFATQFYAFLQTAVFFDVMFKFHEYNIIYINRTDFDHLPIYFYIFSFFIVLGFNDFTTAINFRVIIIRII